MHRKLCHLTDDFHIHGQTAAKAATDHHGVEGHIIRVETGNVDGHHLGRKWVLHAAPNVELPILKMGGQGEWLHHRVVQEWNLIFCFNRFCAKSGLYITVTGFAIGFTLGKQIVLRFENGRGRDPAIAAVGKLRG